MEVREIMTDRFNLLVKTFKQANPNLTHEKAQKRVKDYYDTIKNKFGTHLDENGKIIDGVKELQNFRKAGETLSEIWSKMTIDDYEVSAKWVDPSNASKAYHDFRDSKIGKNWLETHVFISKYYLEIAKSNDIECCQSVRSNVQEVLGGKFLPAPLALSLVVHILSIHVKRMKHKRFPDFIRVLHYSTYDLKVTRNAWSYRMTSTVRPLSSIYTLQENMYNERTVVLPP